MSHLAEMFLLQSCSLFCFLTCKQTFRHVRSSSLNRQVSQLTPVKNLWLYTEPDGV